MSRRRARDIYVGRTVQDDLLSRGIHVKTASLRGLAEEAGGAYKNVDDVVRASADSGLGKIVAKLDPLGNIKG